MPITSGYRWISGGRSTTTLPSINVVSIVCDATHIYLLTSSRLYKYSIDYTTYDLQSITSVALGGTELAINGTHVWVLSGANLQKVLKTDLTYSTITLPSTSDMVLADDSYVWCLSSYSPGTPQQLHVINASTSSVSTHTPLWGDGKHRSVTLVGGVLWDSSTCYCSAVGTIRVKTLTNAGVVGYVDITGMLYGQDVLRYSMCTTVGGYVYMAFFGDRSGLSLHKSSVVIVKIDTTTNTVTHQRKHTSAFRKIVGDYNWYTDVGMIAADGTNQYVYATGNLCTYDARDDSGQYPTQYGLTIMSLSPGGKMALLSKYDGGHLAVGYDNTYILGEVPQEANVVSVCTTRTNADRLVWPYITIGLGGDNSPSTPMVGANEYTGSITSSRPPMCQTTTHLLMVTSNILVVIPFSTIQDSYAKPIIMSGTGIGYVS